MAWRTEIASFFFVSDFYAFPFQGIVISIRFSIFFYACGKDPRAIIGPSLSPIPNNKPLWSCYITQGFNFGTSLSDVPTSLPQFFFFILLPKYPFTFFSHLTASTPSQPTHLPCSPTSFSLCVSPHLFIIVAIESCNVGEAGKASGDDEGVAGDGE